jgi:purine-nucleoside phosphorylase
MKGWYARISETAAFLKERGAAPRAMIVLGTGLGGLGDRLEGSVRIPYEEIPHFPASTSPSHAGELVIGRVGDVEVAAMHGRFHYYEGYDLKDVTFPVRVARALGAETLFITSAVGGMNPLYRKGEIVAIEDHINLMGDSPLRGENDERLGPRFPDMSAPYDAAWIDRAEALALEAGFRLPRAVLVAVMGPQLETRAEYRWLRSMGADVVGMSSVPEAIVATHCGLRTLALSVVTDICLADALAPVDVAEIIATANEAAPRLETLLLRLVQDA